ncbi:MAG: hypothetical protein M3O71_02925 [Bacteroidota bacterium]|nr:hypothetical protein [Bacteroidota bacterium]
MVKKLKLLFFEKNNRSHEIQINTIFNIVLRGLSVLCNFFIVPLALLYIDKTEYGVWLTLTSLTAWLSYMDVGLGNGLRNKLAEAIAKGDKSLAKEYVSTTYVIFSIVIVILIVIFALLNIFLNWNDILKTSINPKILLSTVFLIVSSFCVRLILDLAGTVVTALQKPFLRTLIDFCISFVTLIVIYLLAKSASPSFMLFSAAVALIPLVVLFVFNYLLYWKSRFSYLKPRLKYFKFDNIKSLLNVGVQFFFIQFVGIIIFSTDNILITQFFSPAHVTSFNIAYKYFTISTIAFTVIMIPYWSAFTNAYVSNDIKWINGAFKKLLGLWLIQVVGVVLLVIAANFVYRIWVGNQIAIPISLSISLGVYSIVFNWNNIFAYFINGVSKIRLQLYSSIFIGLVNIPLSYILVKYTQLGMSAIVIANSLCLLISSIWSPIQCYKIINNKATGLWNK